MSARLFRPFRRVLPLGMLLVVCLPQAGVPGLARAGTIVDATGDFLATYTGPLDPGLDVVAHEVRVLNDRMVFFGRMNGPIGPTQAIGGLYLIGVDRGQGTPRFLNSPAAPPIIGPNVRWDSVVRILANGTGAFVNSLTGVTTPLNSTDISIIGNEFTASVPLSLMMTAATRPADQWTYNLWPRNGVGMNVQVSDLAPDDGNSAVVPEPSALMLFFFSAAAAKFGHRASKTPGRCPNPKCDQLNSPGR